jgi:hypothetical protein
MLGAGPLLALGLKLGAIRHRANATQIDDYKSTYSGRTFETIRWFKDFRSKAAGLADQLRQDRRP